MQDGFALFTQAGHILQEKFNEYPEGTFLWIRTIMTEPSFSDLIFSYKNAVFAVVPVHEGAAPDNNALHALIKAADENDLVPCVFPIGSSNETIKGWNLYDAKAYADGVLKPCNPVGIGTDDPKPVSDWELHDLAVRIVMDGLEEDGAKIESFQTMLGTDPQIFFRDEEDKLSWAAVRFSDGISPVKWEEEHLAAIDRKIMAAPEYNGHSYRAVVPILMENGRPMRGTQIITGDVEFFRS